MPSRVPHSSHWGAFVAEVEAGRVVAAAGFGADPVASPLLAAVPDAVHHPTRVAAPAVRRSWFEGGPGSATDRRGGDPFVEVEWDEALDLVAAELRRVKEQHGNAAIFGGSYGWASAGRFHHARTQLKRFLNCFGGCTAQLQNYSYAAAITLLPHVVGTASVVGDNVTSWEVIADSTDTWVLFGGLPVRNLQVESGGIGAHAAFGWLDRVRSGGVHCVGVTPLRSDLPAELGGVWLPIRPGTDTALMLALGWTLLDESLHDRAFLDRYCVGFDRFAAYLTGASDGVAKTPAWAEAITGVPAAAIASLARRMAAGRTLVTATWSLQRQEHGEQPYWMTIVLSAMLGQIGLPGGGFGFGYGDTAGIGSARLPFAVPDLPALHNPVETAIPAARIADMLLDPGGTYEFDGAVRHYPDVRLVYWAGGNPFHHHQDLNRLLRAWRRPETIIVHEPWWTATARHADVVLPATTTLERNDIGASSRDRFLLAMHRAIEPHGEARADYEILSALAERLGVAEQYTEGRDEPDWLRHLYDASRADAARNGIDLPPFEEFWAAGFVELPQPPPTVLFADFRHDPEAAPLATPSGRIEVYSERIASFGYDDCPGHPVWIEPREWLGSPVASQYGLHLISHQPATRLHSQLDMSGPSAASKVVGREPCRLNPGDAARRGIASGDVIRIYNDRGSCLAGAVLDAGVHAGVVALATGAWFDPAEAATPGSLERHGNPNVLTADRGTSRLAQGPTVHTLVEVEPVHSEAPRPEPFRVPTLIRRSARKQADR